MEKYSHRERIQMIIAGEKPDRFAASFWRHFFHMEHHADGTIESTVWFQKEFDWDFVKLNPRADYHTQGWGLHLEYSRKEFSKHIKSAFPISGIDDWSKIKTLPLTSPPLAEHLKVILNIRKQLGKELPILMTVFTPLAIAGRLVADRQTLMDHLRTDPEKVEPALQAITETFTAFVSECRNAGADGIFYATTHWASSDMMTMDEYRRFGVPYDLEVIRAAEYDALNLLHVCESNNYLRELCDLDYRCQLANWDCCDPTNLPMDLAVDQLKGMALVGGVDHNGWLLHARPQEIRYQIDRIKSDHDPSRLIIGPGCAIPPEVPMDNLRAIRERL